MTSRRCAALSRPFCCLAHFFYVLGGALMDSYERQTRVGYQWQAMKILREKFSDLMSIRTSDGLVFRGVMATFDDAKDEAERGLDIRIVPTQEEG